MFMAQLSYSFEGPNDTHHGGRYIFELDRKKTQTGHSFWEAEALSGALLSSNRHFWTGEATGVKFSKFEEIFDLVGIRDQSAVFTRKGWLQIRCDVINHSPLIFVQCEEIRARSNVEWLELGNLILLKFRAPENRAPMPQRRKLYKVHTQNLN